MDDDKLNKGIELKNQIKAKQSQLKAWKESKTLHTIQTLTIHGTYNYVFVDCLDFETIQAIATTKLAKELNNLQEEYDNA